MEPDHAAPRLRAGYTLIELTVVITILGVLSATIAPRFFTQSVFSERGYADELGSALRATQKAAVISGCHARLPWPRAPTAPRSRRPPATHA